MCCVLTAPVVRSNEAVLLCRPVKPLCSPPLQPNTSPLIRTPLPHRLDLRCVHCLARANVRLSDVQPICHSSVRHGNVTHLGF